jgi:hypothetical protein
MVYTGDIMNTHPHGIGTLTDITDGEIHKGTFKNGKFIEGIRINNYGRYEGTFNENGDLYGKGIIYYKNGDCFEGNFEHLGVAIRAHDLRSTVQSARDTTPIKQKKKQIPG